MHLALSVLMDTDGKEVRDYKLGEDGVSSLSVNATSSEQLIYTLSSSIPDGNYYVGWIVDALAQVTESNENNGFNLSSQFSKQSGSNNLALNRPVTVSIYLAVVIQGLMLSTVIHQPIGEAPMV